MDISLLRNKGRDRTYEVVSALCPSLLEKKKKKNVLHKNSRFRDQERKKKKKNKRIYGRGLTKPPSSFSYEKALGCRLGCVLEE